MIYQAKPTDIAANVTEALDGLLKSDSELADGVESVAFLGDTVSIVLQNGQIFWLTVKEM